MYPHCEYTYIGLFNPLKINGKTLKGFVHGSGKTVTLILNR
jgi:hypothetical protein